MEERGSEDESVVVTVGGGQGAGERCPPLEGGRVDEDAPGGGQDGRLEFLFITLGFGTGGGPPSSSAGTGIGGRSLTERVLGLDMIQPKQKED